MSYKAPDLSTWLTLPAVEAFLPLAQEKRVSEIARRSKNGFLRHYRKAEGDPVLLMDMFCDAKKTLNWYERRNNFVNRHMAQVDNRNEPLWLDNGEPTRRHLALIIWAYSPDVSGVRQWLKENRG